MFSGLTIGWRIALGFIVVQTINAGALLAVFGFVPDTGIAIAVTTAAGAIVSILTRTAITRPLKLLRDAMGRLAHKEAAIEIDGTDRGDEIGEMAKALLVLR